MGLGSFKNLQNHWARIAHIYMKAIYRQCDLMAIKKSNVACVHRRNINQNDAGERCCPWASCLYWSHAKVDKMLLWMLQFCLLFL
jgi:hypothetical protein